MSIKLSQPQFSSLKKQVEEIKDLIEDGLKTPALITNREENLIENSYIPLGVSKENDQVLATLQTKINFLENENKKLKYQLLHVQKSCESKDILINQLEKISRNF